MSTGAAEFDYVVVGAGAAGCVVAARLSEDPSVTVALLEAGGRDWSPMIGIPGANVVTGTKPEFNWNYESEPVPALHDRRLYWSQGRILGGSSSINGMMYVRGRRRDYDGWRDLGCIGWGYDDVLPLFRRSESNERGESEIHGASGPLMVSKGRSTAPVCDMFLEAAAQSGYRLTDDLNKDERETFGHADMTIGKGRRSSTAAAFLRPAQRRRNVTVFTRSQAARILIEKGVARGVKIVRAGRASVVRARREVVVACGAVNSPQLLMLSGIGPAAHLKEHGIAVVADRPSVGENLQNHPMYRMLYATTRPVTAYAHLTPRGLLTAGWQYLFARQGVLSRGLFPTSGFLYAEDGQPETEIQVSIAPALVIRRGPGVFGVLPTEHGFTLLLNHGSPFSRGRVRLKSGDPLAKAAIFPEYFSDPRDIDILAKGAERVRAMMHQPALRDVLGREIQPKGPIRTRDDIADDIRLTTVTHYHAGGTCRMGSDPDSVVDPELRVRGVEGLRVADASVMPVMINGNTYAAAVMIGEKAADLIRAA
jgi:choline dehydrogenase